MDTLVRTPRFGFPPNYKIEQTGLFFSNGNTTPNREVPYHFHTNPQCHSITAVETLAGTSLYEVTIFRNIDTDELFYVKPQDGKTAVVEYCGTCATSLFKLIRRPGEWVERAACRDMPLDVFFPENEGRRPTYGPAVAVCGGCPVRSECLDYALETRQTAGYIGGTTPTARRDIWRARARNES